MVEDPGTSTDSGNVPVVKVSTTTNHDSIHPTPSIRTMRGFVSSSSSSSSLSATLSTKRQRSTKPPPPPLTNTTLNLLRLLHPKRIPPPKRHRTKAVAAAAVPLPTKNAPKTTTSVPHRQDRSTTDPHHHHHPSNNNNNKAVDIFGTLMSSVDHPLSLLQHHTTTNEEMSKRTIIAHTEDDDTRNHPTKKKRRPNETTKIRSVPHSPPPATTTTTVAVAPSSGWMEATSSQRDENQRPPLIMVPNTVQRNSIMIGGGRSSSTTTKQTPRIVQRQSQPLSSSLKVVPPSRTAPPAGRRNSNGDDHHHHQNNGHHHTMLPPPQQNPAAQWISRPPHHHPSSSNREPCTDPPDQKSSTQPKKKKKNAGNFVRLNLRNKGGSCLPTANGKGGSRRSNSKNNNNEWWEQRKKDRLEHDQALRLQELEEATNESSGTTTSITAAVMDARIRPLLAAVGGANTTTASFVNTTHGMDIIDDFVDGRYHPPDPAPDESQRPSTTTSSSSSNIQSKPKKARTASTIPNCSGHLQPCKLCTVKKSGPNRGRQFYVCATSSRIDQCPTFIWVDDTVSAAQSVLSRNRSVSGFIARRVAAYMEQRSVWTVPELKQWAQTCRLDTTGSKAQLRTRLSVWVRDEIARGCREMGLVEEKETDELNRDANDDEESSQSPNSVTPAVPETGNENKHGEESSDDDDDSSSSEDELELIGAPMNRQDMLLRPSHHIHDSTKNAATTVDLSDSDPDDNEGTDDSKSSSLYSTLKQLFGYTKFRDGQEWAIHRCLNHQRSLLVAPTGFGKSLCYTLPAAMMDGVAIVVSPLLSLIQDQIRMLPARLAAAATLSGSMSTASVTATLDDIVRGRIKLLFVSPERLTSSSFRRLFRPTWNVTSRKYERYFPEVSVFCVDEAHCMSQWAHNFRPSYLRLQSIIELINPKSILAMTATAGPKVVDDICCTLGIDNATLSGVRVSKTNRDNIDVKCLFLNTQEERIAQLMQILRTPDKDTTKTSEHAIVDGCLSTGSVIVYTWRQYDAEAVAEHIQAADIKGGVVVYHGGMDATSRAKAQSKFMRGKARICVATIAFGLGINKADVTGIVHLYLSSSPEHYIQEIGRAGRDGRPAQAISLILNDEVIIRHSLSYSDLISKSQVKALIEMVRQQVTEARLLLANERPESIPVNVAFQLALSVVLCDCKIETAETILSLLEQRNGKEPLLLIQGISYDRATIAPKRCLLEKLAANEPVLQSILKCADRVEPPAGQPDGYLPVRRSAISNNVYGSYTFSVAKSSNCLGDAGEPRHVFAALRRLESNDEIGLTLEAAPSDRVLSLRLTNEGMKYFQENNDDEFDELVNEIYDRFVASITSCSSKVVQIHQIMRQVSAAGPNTGEGTKSASLIQFQQQIEQYFEAEGTGNLLTHEASDLPNCNNEFSGRELAADIDHVLSQLHNIQAGSSKVPGKLQLSDASVTDYTVLTVTKFLHGLAPASIPLNLIRQHHLFGKMQYVQFDKLLTAVGRILSYS